MDETVRTAAKRRARFGVFLATCAVLALMGESARAQSESAAVEAPALDIAAQPLDAALEAFSRQTGIRISAAPELLAGRSAGAAQGRLAPAEGLTRILAGTGLSFSFTAPDAATITPGALGAAPSEAILLEPITIYAGGADATWGPVAGVVADRTGTGSKTVAEILDIPASVSVVTGDEMRARGVTDLDGALRSVAGVATNLYGADERFDFVAIRGFNQTNSGIYRDGLPMRLYNLTSSRVEPYGMERVEVLKGSTSTLYGANNPGGLVNMITKRPLDYKFGEVYAAGGQDHLEFGADFGGPIDSEGVLTYRLTGKLQDATLANGVSTDDRLYIAPALTWKPSDRTAVTLMADYNEREGANRYGIPRGSGIDPWTFLGEPDFDRNDTTEWSVGFALEHDFNNGLVFRSHGRHSEIEMDNENVYAAGNLHPKDGRLSWQVEGELERDSLDAHLQYDAAFGRFKSRSLIGADYTQAETAEQVRQGTAGGLGDIANPVYCGRACVTLRPFYNMTADEKTWGVYGQEELTLDDRWILTLGARYDQVEATANSFMPVTLTEDAVTLRGGLTFKITDGLSVYGTYSESFTPVLPSDQLATLIQGLGVKTDPMMGEMYELGVKWRPANMNALFSAAVYDLTQTNVPRFKTFSGPPFFGIEQDGEVRSRGLELEAKAELTDRTNLILAYSYTDAEVTKSASGLYDGSRPMFIPEHMASVWVDHTIPGAGARGDLTLGLGARYVGSRFANENNSFELGSNVVFDAAAKYRILEDTDLTLNVENLFDREYVSHVETWSEPDTEFYGNPRTFRLTLRRSW